MACEKFFVGNLKVTMWLIFFATVIMGTLSASCGRNPAAPSPSRNIRVYVGLAGTPFSVTLDGRTITADGAFSFDLAPGEHDISGTFSSGIMVVAFSGGLLTDGGVQSGSLRSLQGIEPIVDSCGASWGTLVPGLQPFRLRFTVTTNKLSACQ